MFNMEFYRGKRVFITGHTGFKGAWLCKILVSAGAEVTGYSLEPPTNPSLYEIAGIGKTVHSVIGDICNFGTLKAAFDEVQPEIVFHLAAQPIVLESYRNPRETYEINVMGTVNLLECIRQNMLSTGSVRSVLNVTTDKVYQNREWVWGYREDEPLDGYDPYSNSKSCSELVTHSYNVSFFQSKDGTCLLPVSTARAGNVIGGGDFAADRIIPDCVRSACKKQEIFVRNPHSIRPYQHVLEPLSAYLMIAAKQYEDSRFAGYYNVGPDEKDCYTTGKLVDVFVKAWGDDLVWVDGWKDGMPHEANFLKLDCSKLKSVFNWEPRWDLKTAVEKVVEWSKCFAAGENICACMDRQIEEFFKE